jgi:hypothetical protein
MGHDFTKIPVPDAIERARAGKLMSWSTGLPQRIMPEKVKRAELRDDGVIVLYYHNRGQLKGRPGRGYSEFDDLWQEFDPADMKRQAGVRNPDESKYKGMFSDYGYKSF